MAHLLPIDCGKHLQDLDILPIPTKMPGLISMTSDRWVGRVITTALVIHSAGHDDGGTYQGAWEHSRGVGDTENPLISQPPPPHLNRRILRPQKYLTQPIFAVYISQD